MQQMRTLRADIRGANQHIARELMLHNQVPILHVTGYDILPGTPRYGTALKTKSGPGTIGVGFEDGPPAVRIRQLHRPHSSEEFTNGSPPRSGC